MSILRLPSPLSRLLLIAAGLLAFAATGAAAETGPAAPPANPVLLDFKAMPPVQWAHWYKKVSAESDGIRVTAEQAGGNIVYDLGGGRDLGAYLEWTPRLTLRIGPGNKTNYFCAMLHDGSGNVSTYEFTLANPVAGTTVTLLERDGASIREPNQIESYSQRPPEYSAYGKITLAGRLSHPVDVVFQRLDLVPPDPAILRQREALRARHVAADEARRRKREAQRLGFVSSVFADGMVLQRGIPIPVWGRGRPGERIAVAFSGVTAETTAGQDGSWRVALAPQAADPSGRTLEISGDGRRVAIGDVLVGDVWLYSGQSNMQMALKASRGGPEAVAAADHPRIRFLSPPIARAYEPLEAFDPADVRWRKAVAAEAKGLAELSAIAYWTAVEIEQSQGVPIGIINIAQGSTAIIAWMSSASVATVSPELSGKHFPVYFNGNINPLIPFGLRGVVWYQGEQEGGQGPYEQWLRAMIGDWRTRFGRPDLAFGIVQLPENGAPDASGPPNQKTGWGRARDMQRRVLDLPETGLAVTLGVAEGIDTTVDIHPPNKQAFAHRIATMLLGRFYGAAGAWTGPLPQSARRHAGAVRIAFDQVGGGLAATDGAALRGFALAGADGNFVWATAAIVSRSEVELSAPGVPDPRAVRYAWHRNPTANAAAHGANLGNDAGLPAGSFELAVEAAPAVDAPAR